MLKFIVKTLLTNLLKECPPEKVRAAADKTLDAIEKKIEESATKLDDAIVLPIIKKIIREPFGIEDNDTETAAS